MSRGWESKSVESQQDEAAAAEAQPSNAQKAAKVVELRGNIAADAEQKRKRQALELQRERILSDKTPHPHRRSALAAALIDVEEKLSELGWTLHL